MYIKRDLRSTNIFGGIPHAPENSTGGIKSPDDWLLIAHARRSGLGGGAEERGEGIQAWWGGDDEDLHRAVPLKEFTFHRKLSRWDGDDAHQPKLASALPAPST